MILNKSYIILFLVIIFFILLILVNTNNKPEYKEKSNKLNNLLNKAQKILNKENFTDSPNSEKYGESTNSVGQTPVTTMNEILETKPNPTTSVYETETNEEVSSPLNNILKSLKEINTEQNNDNSETTNTPETTSNSCDLQFKNVDEVVSQLDDLEQKCNTYEEEQTKKNKLERERLKEIYNEQLEIETGKINELKNIVNYYRKRYNSKLSINNKCRKDKQLDIKNTIKSINRSNVIENPKIIKQKKCPTTS